jgi:hypothetical protein
MNTCLKANLLTALSMVLIIHGISNLVISKQDARIASNDDRLNQAYDNATNDLAEAKKLELQALESARVAEKALADAKKKLSECK